MMVNTYLKFCTASDIGMTLFSPNALQCCNKVLSSNKVERDSAPTAEGKYPT